MRRSPLARGIILVGLIGLSLSLYWAAESSNRLLETILLGVVGATALAAIWSGR